MINPITKTVQFFTLCTFICLNSFGGNTPKLPEGFKPETNSRVSFTENKGQVCDQNYKPRPDILFSGSDGQLNFHLKNNGISYQLNRVDTWKENSPSLTLSKGGRIEQKSTALSLSNGKVPDQSTIYRLDITWLNANTKANIMNGKALEGYNNYYLEQCPNGALNVNSYLDVTYQNIYAGIDLKWYQKDGHLKYDYLVAPGADYKQIKLEIKGAEKISINSKGELVYKTPMGEIIEQAPIVTQQGRLLKSKWVAKDNSITYDIDNLNPTQGFIIDPGLRVWGTYYGDTSADYAYSCSTDAIGNVYMCGETVSSTSTLIATSGSHQSTFGGAFDAFLVKFNTAGVRQWACYYGGSGSDYGYSCCTDATGNVYMTGNTDSNTGTVIATTGAHQTALVGQVDAFLVKFNSSGTRQWATYYGGNGAEYAYSCVTDATGNVYLSGEAGTNIGTGVASSGSHQPSTGGFYDAFLAKFDANGVRQWGTYYGGTGFDSGRSCVIDATGNVYMAGFTASSTVTGTVIASTGAHQTAYGGGVNDAFIVKFNASGVRQWGSYYGGSGDDLGYSCSIDASGDVYMAGRTDSNTGTVIATASSNQSTYGGGTYDAFLAKFDAAGVRQWGTYYGGTGTDYGFGSSIDATGNVYISGETSSGTTTLIATSGSHQTFFGGSIDAFLVKFNTTGVRQWGSYYGGSGTEYGRTCSTDAIGNVYLDGYTNTFFSSFITTSGAHQTTLGGTSYDAFLVKFIDCTLPSNPVVTNQTICAANSATLTANSGTATINWYSTPTSTAVLGTGPAYITTTLGIGTYTYYAEAFTCVSSAARSPITLTVNANPTIAVNSGSICAGTTFTLSPSGANTYTIQGGSTILTPLTSGNYTVVGTSTAGCLSGNTATSNITVNPIPTISVNSGSICIGNSFLFIPSGANSYSYSSGSSIVSPTLTTSYSITGTSTAGCVSAVVVANISVSNSVAPTISVNNGTICTGQSFTINPNGASTYTFSGGLAVVSPTANSTYSVIGTSTASCVSSNTAISTIIVNLTPTISVNNGSICTGNSFTINPTGASTYTYSSGTNVVSPLTNTVYNVTGTSAQGCVSSNTAISSVTVNITPTISVNSGSICSGKSFTINPSGANTYSYTGGSAIVSPLTNATYNVTGYSAQGCVSTNVLISSVTVFNTPTVSVNSGSICSGASFTMIPSGASGYTVSGGNLIVSPLTNTVYTVIGTSTAGCVSSNTAISSVTVNLTPSLSVNNGSICAGNSFTIIPTGASTYSYSSGVSIVSPLTNTFYHVTGTSAQGCVASNTAICSVSVNSTPTITANSGSICSGSSFTISPSGAVSYSYSSVNSVVSPFISTNYTVTGFTALGCTNAAISSVSVSASPTITVNSGSLCTGNSFTLNPLGALTYTISGGNTLVSPLTTTVYTIIGTSTAGCISTNTAISSITVNTLPVILVNSGSLCSGKSFTIIASGASTYSYTGGSNVVSPLTNTVYNVIGTSAQGCLASNTALCSLTVNTTPSVTVNSGSICSGSSFTLIASGAVNYSYSNSSSIVNPITNTNYTVTGSSAQGCTNIAIASVSVSPAPTITVNSGSICEGTNFTITPGGATAYTISGGATVVSPLNTSTYAVVGTNSLGCIGSNTAIATVTVNSLPILVTSSTSSLLCEGETTTITVSGANTYSWSNGGSANNIIVNPTVSVTYIVTGADTKGCSKTEIVTQNVSPCAGIESFIFNSQSLISLYPNPNTGEFIIESPIPAEITIVNAIGQLINQQSVLEGKNKIDLTHQAKGIYLIKMFQNGKLINQEKFIKME
jgi:hypothetical protein